jgi:hypothetical protein
MANFRLAAGLILILALPVYAETVKKSSSKKISGKKEPVGQKSPTIQRQEEIRQALILHGYEPGPSWADVKELCRQIADERHWQTSHIPDSRVLILIGLGSKNSNPWIAHQYGGFLDELQRHDAENRKHKE